MPREDIIESHFAKARSEMALVYALVPVAVAIFVIVFAASIGRPSASSMVFGVLCAAPLILLRDNRLGDSKPLGFLAGVALCGAAGFLATREIWVTAVTGGLGFASVWLFFRKRDDTENRPKLNANGQARLNAELTAAGFEEMPF